MSDLRGLARFFLCVQAIPNICLIYRRFPAISAFLRLPGPKNRRRPGFPFFLQTHTHDALWGSREGGTNLLSWSDDGLVYLISGSLPLNELIRIAENITLSPAPAP